VNGEQPKDDVQCFVTCTYCGTQTQLSLKRSERDRPLICATCGAPLKVVPPPKKPIKKKKKPFDDYDAMLAERHAYESRTEGESKKAGAVAGIMTVATILTIFLLYLLFRGC
jgi:transcription elongation factor Elf1